MAGTILSFFGIILLSLINAQDVPDKGITCGGLAKCFDVTFGDCMTDDSGKITRNVTVMWNGNEDCPKKSDDSFKHVCSTTKTGKDEVVSSDGWNSGESNAVILSDRVVDSKACFSVSDGELESQQNVETSEHVIGDGVKAICSGPDNFCLKGKPSELQWCIVVPGCKMSSNNGGDCGPKEVFDAEKDECVPIGNGKETPKSLVIAEDNHIEIFL